MQMQMKVYKMRNMETGETFRSHGATPQIALDHCSNVGQYEIIGESEIPYTLAPFVEALCRALPGDWDAEPISDEYENCSWKIRRTTDNLTLSVDGPDKFGHPKSYSFRLHAAHRPKGTGYVDVYENNQRVPYPSIKVGIQKSPEQIAKDVVRRLLPDAARVNGLVLKKLQQEEEAENQRFNALKTFCECVKIPVPRERHSNDPLYSSSIGGMSFSVTYDGNISLEFHSMPLAKAARVAREYREIQ